MISCCCYCCCIHGFEPVLLFHFHKSVRKSSPSSFIQLLWFGCWFWWWWCESETDAWFMRDRNRQWVRPSQIHLRPASWLQLSISRSMTVKLSNVDLQICLSTNLAPNLHGIQTNNVRSFVFDCLRFTRNWHEKRPQPIYWSTHNNTSIVTWSTI